MRQLSRWLGLDGDGERSLQYSWPLPAWLTILLALATAMFVLRCYRRQIRAALSMHDSQPASSERRRARRWLRLLPLLRLGSLAVLAWMMFGASWRRYETDLPELLLVVDDSQSMAQVDGDEGLPASRFEQVRQRLLDDEGRRLRRLSQRYRLRLLFLADDLRDAGAGDIQKALRQATLAPTSRRAATRLGDGLSELLAAQRTRTTAAMLVFSDGVTTAGRSLRDAADDAKRRGVPLWFAGVGSEQFEQDLRLADLVYPTTVFPGDLAQLHAKLYLQGGQRGSRSDSAIVQLREGDRVLDEVEVALDQQEDERVAGSVKLSYRAEQPGDHALSVVAVAREGERNLANNQVQAEISVRDETIRVLMLQGHPSFDFQFLRNLLSQGLRRDEADSAFALTTVLQDSDPEYASQDAHAARVFPATRDELMSYDVLIIGDADPGGLSQSQKEDIVAFVEQRGGALVLLSGPHFLPRAWRETPLEPLLPVDLGDVEFPHEETLLDREWPVRLTLLGADAPHLQLSDRPEDNDALWRKMPPLYWLVRAPAKPDVRVLLTAPRGDGQPDSPVVCSRYYGAGLVHFHATDESYRWSAHPEGRQFYARYWLQTLRQLSRAKLGESDGVELATDAERYARGQSVRFRVKFSNLRAAPAESDGVLLSLESGGRRRQLRLQRSGQRRELFEGRLDELPDGSYRAWLADPVSPGALPTCSFVIEPPQSEQTRLRTDLEAMREAATETGGRAVMLPKLDDLLDNLPSGRQLRIRPLPPHPIWNSWWAAAALVALLTGEWLLRRANGLP